MAWDCQNFHCLPRAGGLEDQLIKTMVRMRTAQNVFDAMSMWHAADKAGILDTDWMQRNKHAASVATWVLILRTKNNA